MTSRILIDTGPSRKGWHYYEATYCMQKFAFRYIIGINDTTVPLIRGTLGHVGMAHLYKRLWCVQHGQDPEVYYEPLDAIAVKADQLGPIGQEHCATVQLAVRDYIAHYSMETIRIHGVEEEVSMFFGPHELTQRWDLDVVDSNGVHWIWDHKFVGAIQAKSVTRYVNSGQFLNMMWQGRNRYGEKFGGVRINLVGVDNRKFLRATLPPAPDALMKFPQKVADSEALIQSCVGRDPWNYPRANSELVCMTPYGPCPYLELCSWGPRT